MSASPPVHRTPSVPHPLQPALQQGGDTTTTHTATVRTSRRHSLTDCSRSCSVACSAAANDLSRCFCAITTVPQQRVRHTHLGGQQQRTECAVMTRHREPHQLSFSKSLCLRALRLTSSPHKGQYKMSTGAERSHERRGTSATTSCARAALIDSSRAAYTPHQRRKLRLIYSNHHHPTHPEVQRS
jgi:hypothetical protein